MATRASASGGKRISQNEFTEKAWQSIIAAPDIAQNASQQIVDTEHLFKALLEQPNGLARRVLSKAGSNPTQLLEKTDQYIRQQPRVTGDSSQVQNAHAVTDICLCLASTLCALHVCFHGYQTFGKLAHICYCFSQVLMGQQFTIWLIQDFHNFLHLHLPQNLLWYQSVSRLCQSVVLYPAACTLTVHRAAQVLGRNLEALVTRAQDIKADWRDEFVSVEHMLLAFLDDAKFGTNLLKGANLDKAKLEAAVKEIRGSNRVTDQVGLAGRSLAISQVGFCNILSR